MHIVSYSISPHEIHPSDKTIIKHWLQLINTLIGWVVNLLIYMHPHQPNKTCTTYLSICLFHFICDWHKFINNPKLSFILCICQLWNFISPNSPSLSGSFHWYGSLALPRTQQFIKLAMLDANNSSHSLLLIHSLIPCSLSPALFSQCYTWHGFL